MKTPQNHLKQEAELQNAQIRSTKTSKNSSSITINHASPSSPQEPKNSDTPSTSKMHAGTKRQNTTPKGESSSRPTKRIKQVDPNSAEEISKEMLVGFELDKYWYDSTPFPQLHVILQN